MKIFSHHTGYRADRTDGQPATSLSGSLPYPCGFGQKGGLEMEAFF